MMILICNDKGGVGKSTIAPELAVYLHDLGSKVGIVDADRQMHTAKHVSKAEPGIPVGALGTAKEIKKAIPKLKKKYDYIIADAPANLGAETWELMKLAEAIIIPIEPGLKSFESTVATYELVVDAREKMGRDTKHVYVVFNKVQLQRKKKYLKYRDLAKADKLPVIKNYIRFLKALNDCDDLETTVSRMKSTAETREAQADITAVFAEIFHSMLKPNTRAANG